MQQPFDKSLSEADDDEFLDDIDDTDYVLILDSNGELKTVMMPEDYNQLNMPETVSKILEVCGVNTFENRTIH
jgi:hypothetical protein